MNERVTLPDGRTLVNDLQSDRLFRAVAAILSKYPPPEEGKFSVTTLLKPPQIVHLERTRASEIVENASERLYAALGSAFHLLIEGVPAPDSLDEQGLGIEREGYRITGRCDEYNPSTRTLYDHKVVSVWELLNGVKAEKEAQLNLYAHLGRECKGWEVEHLVLDGMYRDWSKTQAGKKHPPSHEFHTEVEVWTTARCEEFLLERLHLHVAAAAGEVPCTNEDRWLEERWAVMKKGRKTAVKLFDQADEAAAWLSAQDDKHRMSIEHRPGRPTRCLFYCAARDICPQYARESA